MLKQPSNEHTSSGLVMMCGQTKASSRSNNATSKCACLLDKFDARKAIIRNLKSPIALMDLLGRCSRKAFCLISPAISSDVSRGFKRLLSVRG